MLLIKAVGNVLYHKSVQRTKTTFVERRIVILPFMLTTMCLVLYRGILQIFWNYYSIFAIKRHHHSICISSYSYLSIKKVKKSV